MTSIKKINKFSFYLFFFGDRVQFQAKKKKRPSDFVCVCVKFVAHLLSMFPVYISTRTRFSMGHKKINQEMKRKKKKNALTRKRLKMNAAGVAEVLTFFLSKSITDDGRRFISRDIRHVNCFDDNNNNSKVSKGAVYGRKKSVWGNK